MATKDSLAERRPRLLVLRALGLGDCLTGVPALRALADAFPDHTHQLVAPALLSPLVGLLDGDWQLVDGAPLAPLDRALARPDVAVNLHGRGPQSHRALLESDPGRLIAFRHPEVRASAAGPSWLAGEHEVARWCRMLAESGVPADRGRLELNRPAPAAAASGATIVHPGAASAARRWPADRFAAVARFEREAGRTVLVTGASGELELAREVARAAGLSQQAVLAGRTGLAELAALVAAAGRVVCGDTGIAHLATALGTPSVVLFGPTSPAHWGPPHQRPVHIALWAGRHGDPHAGQVDAGLLEIEVEDVLDALHAGPPRSGG